MFMIDTLPTFFILIILYFSLRKFIFFGIFNICIHLKFDNMWILIVLCIVFLIDETYCKIW